jgi:hypothetical protein
MQRGKSWLENCQIFPDGYNSSRQLAIQSLGGEEEREDGDPQQKHWDRRGRPARHLEFKELPAREKRRVFFGDLLK